MDTGPVQIIYSPRRELTEKYSSEHRFLVKPVNVDGMSRAEVDSAAEPK